MLYKIIKKNYIFKKIKNINFLKLKNVFKSNIYYSSYIKKKSYEIFGFSKNISFFNKKKILKSKIFKKNFTFLSYDFFLNLKKNFYKYFKFFTILPEYLFIKNYKINRYFFVLRKNNKKNIIKFKKIKKQFKNEIFFKNFYFKKKKNKNKIKYKKIFFLIKKLIKAGTIMQLQISKYIIIKSNVEIFLFFNFLKKRNLKNNNLIYLNLIKNKLLSFSPETLIIKKYRKINVFPIAGSIKRGKNIIFDIFYEFKLKKDKKELAEHLMLIDLSRNDLNKISILGKTNVIKSFYIKKYFFLQHLISNISSKLKKKNNNFKILSSVHPAGTLTGAPKILSTKIINKYEKNGRNFYGGCYGIFEKKNLDLIIVIRSCVFYKNYLFLHAASGIVNNSKIKFEWKELNNKLKIFYYKK
ncbi:chorismate-binding protein [Candidatus Vidania fulgoroideorum]